jgi:hypothetical protein
MITRQAIRDHVLRCACALACISCGDALGLHDLSQAQSGDPGSQSAPAGSAATAAASVADDGGADEGSVPSANAPTTRQNDLTAIAVADAAASSAPGVVPGAPPVDSLDSAGSAPGNDAGGCGCGSACAVHSNGVGQTFEDCVPSGTYDAPQALRACAAFAGGSASCTIQSCSPVGSGPDEGVPGNGGPNKTVTGQAACSTGASACDCWTFSGENAGLVQSTTSTKCDPCAKGAGVWN